MSTAVIIAGGRSTRFEGGDKAVAELAGVPMVRRVGDRLSELVSAVVVNCRADQRARLAAAFDGYPHDVRFAIDTDPDAGPMAGIGQGLRAVTDEFAVVVACDMPFVAPDLVAYLYDAVRGHDAAIPEIDGWYQTTQAVYRADVMASACEQALARGESKVLAPLEALDWTVVPEATLRERGWLDSFRNVNTCEELRAAERDIETPSDSGEAE